MGYEAYQKVKGTKQGQFKGETTRVGWDQHAPILSIDYSVLAPRDASTGKAKGKRHHKPVVVLKEWGASSPQLFSAVASNELLSEVNFFFVEKDDNGKDRVYYTITLSDAHIIAIRKFSGSANAGDPATSPNAKNP